MRFKSKYTARMSKVYPIDLPPYVVRKSTRARHLQLKISPKGELHVVVPMRVSLRAAHDFLLTNLAWVRAHSHLVVKPETVEWPNFIQLPAIGREWRLQFNFSGLRNRVKESTDCLQLTLTDHCFSHLRAVVRHWLLQKAKVELQPWLHRLSRSCGLPYAEVSFRGQAAVWGTCSKIGKICLNYKLLCLPKHYVEYVIIHELCHTVHFNHSANFWRLVSEYIPNWRELRFEVKRADKLLPLWLKD